MITDPTSDATADRPSRPSAADPELVAVADHAAWMPLARDAYQRLADRFAGLDADDWNRSTPCAGWTVLDLGRHLVGAMRSAASLRETVSQQVASARRAKRTGEQVVDAMTAIQIERAADLDPAGVVAELQSSVGAAVKGRASMPSFVRRRAGFRVRMSTIDERWDLDYFLGCILTRDAWLHRVDLADALGVEPALDDADRAIIGDVAVEWARRHGQPVSLTLTGRAGGHLIRGAGGPDLTLDAVEFCRVVSGRSSHDHPLLAQEVPF